MLGAASAWIVVHWRIEPLERFPLWMLKWVTKLIGRRPSMTRLFLAIFGFNSAAMFLYMCTGVWVILPAMVCFLTGMNLAIIFVRGQPTLPGEEADSDAAPAELEAELAGEPPLKLLPLICGLLVVLLELPAFWYSIGMGISLGHYVRDHFSLGAILLFRYPTPGMALAMGQRMAAYLQIIVPVLAVSALAEAYAVREASRAVAIVTRGRDDRAEDA